MSRIWKFAITGGPCGGKTKGIPIIKKFFESRGYKVFIIPEAATIVKSQIGINPTDFSVEDFEGAILEIILFFEEKVYQYASKLDTDVIILCDRGIMDNKAYSPYEEFLHLLAKNNLTEKEALSRYDAAFHLITAADGAEDAYKNEGAREETIEEARILDKKTQEAWSSHPNHYVFDNSTNFDRKIYRLIWKMLEIVLEL